MEFKDHLKRLRTEKGITQEALGQLIHVSRSAIAKWEAGLGMPSEESLEALCVYFEVDRTALFPNDEAEVLLVEKNVKIKRNKNLVIILGVILSVAILIGAVLGIDFAFQERKEAALRAQLVPVVTDVYFPEKNIFGSEEDRVYIYEGNYMLLQDAWVTVYIEMEIDERIMGGYHSFVVDFEGIGWTDDAEHTLTQTPVLALVQGDGYPPDPNADPYVRKYTYALEFWTGEADVSELKIETLTYIQVLDGVRTEKAAVIEAEPIPIKIEDEHYVTLDVNFNEKTLISFNIPMGKSVDWALFDGSSPMLYKELMLRALIENELAATPGVGRQLQFNGWSMADGSNMTEPLFRDATLVADVTYQGDASLAVMAYIGTVDSNGVRLFEECAPSFKLNGQSYGNVGYTLSSDSECVEIVEGGAKIRGIKPGAATVTVEYDLGFAAGTTSFDVTVVDYARVTFFPFGSVQLFYDEATGDFAYEGERYEKMMSDYEAMSGDAAFEQLTGHTRMFVGLYRVDDVTFIPRFESDYTFDGSFIRLFLCDGVIQIRADEIPEAVYVEIGDSLAQDMGLVNSPYDHWRYIAWVDDPSGILVDGIATKTGELTLYYYHCFDEAEMTIFSDVYAIKVVVE